MIALFPIAIVLSLALVNIYFFFSGLEVVSASIIANPEVLPYHLSVSINPVLKIGGKDSALGNVPHLEGTSANFMHDRKLLPILLAPTAISQPS